MILFIIQLDFQQDIFYLYLIFQKIFIIFPFFSYIQSWSMGFKDILLFDFIKEILILEFYLKVFSLFVSFSILISNFCYLATEHNNSYSISNITIGSRNFDMQFSLPAYFSRYNKIHTQQKLQPPHRYHKHLNHSTTTTQSQRFTFQTQIRINHSITNLYVSSSTITKYKYPHHITNYKSKLL